MSLLAIFMLIGTVLAAAFAMSVVRSTRPASLPVEVGVGVGAMELPEAFGTMVDVLENKRADAQAAVHAAQSAVAKVGALAPASVPTDIAEPAAVIEVARRTTADFRNLYRVFASQSVFGKSLAHDLVMAQVMERLDLELRKVQRNTGLIRKHVGPVASSRVGTAGSPDPVLPQVMVDIGQSLDATDALLGEMTLPPGTLAAR